MVNSIFLIASVTLASLSEQAANLNQSFPASREVCPDFQTAQIAPVQDGSPVQQWCCCGACCGWALSCKAVPGCSNCDDTAED